MNTETKFKIGQEIVYPVQGVGLIRGIEERSFKGKTISYYNIYLSASDMTTLIPVSKADDLGLRPIVPKEEAEQALTIIAESFEPLQGDWKTRYQTNHDLLKQGSVIDIATVVRALYHRSKVKELPVMERKLFDNALKLLIDEIAYSLNKKGREVELLIFSKLEPNKNFSESTTNWSQSAEEEHIILDDDMLDED
jgi:CarD family transcriptional regulator